jgi:hypothetical protein
MKVEKTHPLVAEGGQALQQLDEHRSNGITVLQRYGNGALAYNRDHFVDKVRYHLSRSAEEMLEAGRGLLVLKQFEEHGNWLPTLQEIGLEPRLAQRMMQAAQKMLGATIPPNLIKAVEHKSKLFELMVLDEDDLQALNNGDVVAGLQLDEIERMSTSQLRKRLRAELERREADHDSHQRVLEAKEAKINSFEAKLQTLQKSPAALAAEHQAAALARLRSSGFAVQTAMSGFIADVEVLLDSPDSTPLQEEGKNTLIWLAQRFDEALRKHGIPIDFGDMLAPAWMSEGGA